MIPGKGGFYVTMLAFRREQATRGSPTNVVLAGQRRYL
jgi:hypothetical protein